MSEIISINERAQDQREQAPACQLFSLAGMRRPAPSLSEANMRRIRAGLDAARQGGDAA